MNQYLKDNSKSKNVTYLEPTTGLEPVTSSLPRKCSTAELRGPLVLERVMGIEPTSSAWKAEVLPLNYTRLSSISRRLRPWKKFSEIPPSQFVVAAASGHSVTFKFTWCSRPAAQIPFTPACFAYWIVDLYALPARQSGGGGRIRTYVGIASRFTVCPR